MPKRKTPTGAPPPTGEVIIQTNLEDVLHQSMMPYAEHVILERALPRIEDGLKPVQRRILFSMRELSLEPDKPHRKCARIVGDCLGKYHPHSDTSVYDALVRMAQPFNMRGLLVEGHGNFGTSDGDGAAAMRYTEARLAPLAMELLRDIDSATVDFRLNFDDTLKEPEVLPGRFPNLLVNGSSGIAVGLATNMPPHNLREAVAAVIAFMGNEDITTRALMDIIPAPDFPTGAHIVDNGEIRAAYDTGRGKLTLRAKTSIEDGPAGRKLIVVTEFPYQVNKAKTLKDILDVSEGKKGAPLRIHDIRDESDRTGTRAVIELKKDADERRVLAYLYKYTDLQITFGVNMVAIVDGKPAQLSLKDMLRHYVRHQRDVVTRRTRYELEAAKQREHILLGLIIAIDNLDAVIALIRASKSPKEARAGLMARFGLTEAQAQAILDLRLQRLTGLEIIALRKELKEVQQLIGKLEGILADGKKLDRVIRGELTDIAERYGDARRTTLISADDGAGAELPALDEKPPAEATHIVLTLGGFLKRMSPRVYQRRDDGLSMQDMPRTALDTLTDKRLLLITDGGGAYMLPAEAVPEARWRDRGAAPAGLLPDMDNDEAVMAVIEADADSNDHVVIVTRAGMVKRTALRDYVTRMKGRSAALKLKDGDRITAVMRVDGEADGDVLLVTEKGMSIAFALSDTPAQGKAAGGVKGITPALGDGVLYACAPGAQGELLLCTDRGYMKRVPLFNFERQARGGKGARAFPLTKSGSNGARIIAALLVERPVQLRARMTDGAEHVIASDEVRIGGLSDKGMPYVTSLMDNYLEAVADTGGVDAGAPP